MQKKEKESTSKEKTKKKSNVISIDLFGTEILERKASKFGTGCHVIIPKEYAQKEVKIIIKK